MSETVSALDATLVVGSDVILRCPCGRGDLDRRWHEFGEGVMDGHGNPQRVTRRILRALYFDDITGREFCSARCSLLWNDLFLRPLAAHTGAHPRQVIGGWWWK